MEKFIVKFKYTSKKTRKVRDGKRTVLANDKDEAMVRVRHTIKYPVWNLWVKPSV